MGAGGTGRTLSSIGEGRRWCGPRWRWWRWGGRRCVLKVQAAASADGLDLGPEGERIIKIFPLNGGTFPRWERLGGQVLLKGEYKGSVTYKSKDTIAPKDTSEPVSWKQSLVLEWLSPQGVSVEHEKRCRGPLIPEATFL